ncbi:hypothetical protein [Candidatus Mycoplasma haematominutum]|uniref:Lipoprotein n=1 Tax=Candidatus Mycoplasma haematominutum 'Birmingham 1' TaxID=1116213 RepID=G8C3U2_9MOLU|nr:hypothetical protein [Candidatus Mycoplasma haematominutum]CCE66990.1 hypothetical protein MHM_04720 [Candidatus Mycoplasma haematominutum 'Birmingham 1']
MKAAAWKTILGTIGTGGACSAVGVPISMSSISALPLKSGELNEVQISKCNANNVETDQAIDFGSAPEEKICWAATPSEGGEFSPTAESELTAFLRDQWRNKGNSWHSVTFNDWTQQCTDSTSGWVILVAEDNSKYLGLCKGNDSESLWVKQSTPRDKSSLKLEFCSGECFATSEGENVGTKKYTSAVGSWKEVKFFKQQK